MVKDYPNVRSHGKGNINAKTSGRNYEAPKRNHFSAVKARGEQTL